MQGNIRPGGSGLLEFPILGYSVPEKVGGWKYLLSLPLAEGHVDYAPFNVRRLERRFHASRTVRCRPNETLQPSNADLKRKNTNRRCSGDMRKLSDCDKCRLLSHHDVLTCSGLALISPQRLVWAE